MEKIKVLFFEPTGFYGPVLSVFVNIIRYLDKERFTPYLVVNSKATGTIGIGPDDGVIIKTFDFGNADRSVMKSGLTRIPALVQFIRSERIDLIHCPGTAFAGALAFLAARLGSARLLVHFHELHGRRSGQQKPYGGLRGKIESFVVSRADRLVAISKFVASQVISVAPRASAKMDVVLNAVDTDKFNPCVDGHHIREEYGIAANAPLVLQLARILQWKRQEDLVRAIIIARQEVPQLRCLIVGWEDPFYTGSFSSYSEELRHMAQEGNLGDSLIIAPARPEAPELMAAADIFAMPSLEEPLGLVVLEAMASGKTIVGADSGGIPEMVTEGLTGYLVPPCSPEALAEKIVLLARDAQLREEMGAAARKRAEQEFAPSRPAAQFEVIYEGMANR